MFLFFCGNPNQISGSPPFSWTYVAIYDMNVPTENCFISFQKSLKKIVAKTVEEVGLDNIKRYISQENPAELETLSLAELLTKIAKEFNMLEYVNSELLGKIIIIVR